MSIISDNVLTSIDDKDMSNIGDKDLTSIDDTVMFSIALFGDKYLVTKSKY